MSVKIKKGVGVDVSVDRHLWIGGSDIPTLMGKSTFGDIHSLTVGKFGSIVGVPQEEKHYMGKYIEYGNVMEPKIRKWWNRNHGFKFVEACAEWEEKGLRANVDGYDFGRKELLEIKTYGDTPRFEEYNMQCQFYMYIFGLKKCTLLMYKRTKDEKNPMEEFQLRFDSSKLEVHELKFDPKFNKNMLSAIHKYNSVAQRFVDDPSIDPAELNNLMVDESLRNEIVAQSNEMARLDALIETHKAVADEYNNMKKALTKKMEEHGVFSLETDEYKFSYIDEAVSSSFDKKRFEAENPELVLKYQKETRRKGYIRVSKVKKKDDTVKLESSNKTSK